MSAYVSNAYCRARRGKYTGKPHLIDLSSQDSSERLLARLQAPELGADTGQFSMEES